MSIDLPRGSEIWRISRAVLVGVPLVAFGGGCQADGEGEIPPEVVHEVSAVAEPAAADLLRTLVGRLTSAMEEGGAAHAVDFCGDEALSLTESVQSQRHPDLVLKRTSFRYRNPANAPDEAEEAALLYFEEAIQSEDSPPASYVQRVSDQEFRYYKPLFLGPVCVQCHGPPESISPEVQALLDERYPGDLATGYEPGDFRGVVRVSVPAPRVAATQGS